jgi:hypothetical protein
VPDLLVGHELDQEAVLGVDARVLELLDGELGESVVEEVELDELLVQAEVERLEVKVAHVCVLGPRDESAADHADACAAKLTFGVMFRPIPPAGPGGGGT